MAGTSLSEVERPHDEYPESVQLSVRNVDAWPKRGRLRVQRITTGSAAQTGQRTASGPAARDAAGVLGDPIRIRIPLRAGGRQDSVSVISSQSCRWTR